MRFIAAALAIALAATTAQAEETNLIFASASPAGSEVSLEFMKPWAERINAQGKGVLHIDYREGFAIADISSAYDRVLQDAVQVSFMLPGLVAGKFPRTQVASLPYVAGNNAEAASVALWRLYADGPLAKEYDRVRPLAMSSISQASVHLLKPIAGPTALGGLKIMATSKTMADVVTHLGAAPISLATFQLYEALQRRTVDGAITGWPSFQPFKLIEVTTYHIDAPLGSSVAVVFMAKAKYDALSPEARAILDANSGEGASRDFGKMWDRVADRARELLRATKGQQLVTPTADEAATLRAKTAPVVDDWLKATPDGKETLDQFTATLTALRAAH
jgi:TRAP-type C4-dicarboxylate transport system substrate-binding protein